MTVVEGDPRLETSRVKRLVTATSGQHERLDASIRAAQPFANRERYGCLLKIQHQFHHELDTLNVESRLSQLIPNLADEARLRLIEQDLLDLGLDPAVVITEPRFDSASIDVPTALGWLCVAEGSKLGAAILLNWAKALGLSETFGARHLAAAPEGRGLRWKTFTAAFDAVELSDAEDERVIAGGRAAFSRFQELVDTFLAPTSQQ
ncbi:biliverdin-producing heme oxygenase [Bradyrhizobium sp.]|uniref:biliverdin-producing heme oxygenase n=1 Tax=Bradyrhizobium sp. TaxID=376 RepID=UPI0039E47A39